jgi:hypothetical protein
VGNQRRRQVCQEFDGMEPGFAVPQLAGTIGVRGAGENARSDAQVGREEGAIGLLYTVGKPFRKAQI